MGYTRKRRSRRIRGGRNPRARRTQLRKQRGGNGGVMTGGGSMMQFGTSAYLIFNEAQNKLYKVNPNLKNFEYWDLSGADAVPFTEGG